MEPALLLLATLAINFNGSCPFQHENEPTFSLRGMKASTSNSPSTFPATQKRPIVYQKLLDSTSQPTTPSPASATHPSSSIKDSLSVTKSLMEYEPPHRQAMVDNAAGLIEYQLPKQNAVSLVVFLLDTSALMDAGSRSIFELVALQFIVDRIDQIDPAIDSVSGITVMDQKLTWSRLVDGESSTGLEVYFEADTVSENVSQDQLERGIQVLLDSTAKAFRKSFNLALNGGHNNPVEPIDEPEPTTGFSLEPVRVPLGLSTIAVGCVSFFALIFISVRCVNNMESGEEGDFNETDVVVTEEKAQHRYPIQQATEQLNLENDSSESDVASQELTLDDNSFSASLVFCPSAAEPRLFDCDQSVIANIENATDSDDDNHYGYSSVLSTVSLDNIAGHIPKESGQTTAPTIVAAGAIRKEAVAAKEKRCKNALTAIDLDLYDNEIRRAEC